MHCNGHEVVRKRMHCCIYASGTDIFTVKQPHEVLQAVATALDTRASIAASSARLPVVHTMT